MSPLNFENPTSFIPERWLPGTGYDDDRRDVLQPFSVGPRNCIGKKYVCRLDIHHEQPSQLTNPLSLANHEMRLILAKVLWNFDLELCPQSQNWADQKTYSLWEKHPLMVKMRPVRRG